MDNEILSHLIDIKERIASVEAKQDTVAQIMERVHTIEQEVTKVKTTVKVFQWTAGLFVAICAAFIKAWKN